MSDVEPTENPVEETPQEDAPADEGKKQRKHRIHINPMVTDAIVDTKPCIMLQGVWNFKL